MYQSPGLEKLMDLTTLPLTVLFHLSQDLQLRLIGTVYSTVLRDADPVSILNNSLRAHPAQKHTHPFFFCWALVSGHLNTNLIFKGKYNSVACV